jgi:hypothetical protein
VNPEEKQAKLEYIRVLKEVSQHMLNSIQRLEGDGMFVENVELDYIKPLRVAQDAYRVAHYKRQSEDSRVELVDEAEFINRDGTMYVKVVGDRGTISYFKSNELLDYFSEHDIVELSDLIEKPYPNVTKEVANG